MSRDIPQRTCLGCQTKKPKEQLVRIVVGENDDLVIDTIGGKGGRGAYVCKLKTQNSKFKANEKCLEMAIEKKSFQRAFKKKIDTHNLWQKRQTRNQKIQNFSSAPQ